MYSRYGNPTTRNVEEKLAKLENAEESLLFASGMAAITTTLLTFLQDGDLVAASRSIYGGTYRFLRAIAPRLGIKTVFLHNDELCALTDRVPGEAGLF
jgi:methionine-gamma-lyase